MVFPVPAAPVKNINSSDFLDYKLEWLIKKDKVDIMEEFLSKNPDIENNTNLLKYLIFALYFLFTSYVLRSTFILLGISGILLVG